MEINCRMNFAELHIGVWGTGVVGSSALRFFKNMAR